MNVSPGPIDRKSSSEAKITLFRSLFRGRQDVYPRRFESRKTGKSGYAPACANEWVPGVCEKPRIKCAECPNRRFLPVTDDVIRWHLSGHDPDGQPFVAGVYPLLSANDYTTSMTGLKFKIAHKRAGSEKWSATPKTQRKRMITFLERVIADLEKQNDSEERVASQHRRSQAGARNVRARRPVANRVRRNRLGHDRARAVRPHHR